MPIYEFFCEPCNTIFNFFSRRVNTAARPGCPRCGRELARQLSLFSTTGKAKGPASDMLPRLDQAKMEQAFRAVAREAENLNEDDPRQIAQMMRKFSEKTGMPLGSGMEEALARVEAGVDPDEVKQEMGGLLSADTMFSVGAKAGKKAAVIKPFKDETLYEL